MGIWHPPTNRTWDPHCSTIWNPEFNKGQVSSIGIQKMAVPQITLHGVIQYKVFQNGFSFLIEKLGAKGEFLTIWLQNLSFSKICCPLTS